MVFEKMMGVVVLQVSLQATTVKSSLGILMRSDLLIAK